MRPSPTRDDHHRSNRDSTAPQKAPARRIAARTLSSWRLPKKMAWSIIRRKSNAGRSCSTAWAMMTTTKPISIHRYRAVYASTRRAVPFLSWALRSPWGSAIECMILIGPAVCMDDSLGAPTDSAFVAWRSVT